MKLRRFGLALFMSMAFMVMQANADVNLFTDHQIVKMVEHGVNQNIDVPFPTGDYPYIGRVGVEYERRNWSYQLSYIHRSNLDITKGNEYYFDGVSIGVKYRYCIYRCR